MFVVAVCPVREKMLWVMVDLDVVTSNSLNISNEVYFFKLN